ncbi:MAG: hypothetical protein ACLR1T_02070 [Evtepia gabavorous]
MSRDESHRFGLNAFKGLGGIYALSRAVARELGLPAEVTLEELQAPSVQKEVRNMVFVTTTDGNHGRGWPGRPGSWTVRLMSISRRAPPLPGRRPFWTQARWRARVLPLGL